MNYCLEVEDLLDMSESPQQEGYQSPAQNFGNQDLMEESLVQTGHNPQQFGNVGFQNNVQPSTQNFNQFNLNNNPNINNLNNNMPNNNLNMNQANTMAMGQMNQRGSILNTFNQPQPNLPFNQNNPQNQGQPSNNIVKKKMLFFLLLNFIEFYFNLNRILYICFILKNLLDYNELFRKK